MAIRLVSASISRGWIRGEDIVQPLAYQRCRRKIDLFVAWGSYIYSQSVGTTVVQHFAQYEVASARPEHTRKSSRCGPRAHLVFSVIYSHIFFAKSWWRKPSRRACQTGEVLDPMIFGLSYSKSSYIKIAAIIPVVYCDRSTPLG